MSQNDLSDLYQSAPMGRAMEAIVRFAAVKRWHMIDTTKTQSLAEHSANVALLARYIAAKAPDMYFGSSVAVAGYALVHDLEEVFTGDIPTLTKRHLSGIKELEEAVLPGIFRLNPPDSQRVKTLIKICDLADGIRFIKIYGIGTTAAWASAGLEKQLYAMFRYAAEEGNWPDEVFSTAQDAVFAYIEP